MGSLRAWARLGMYSLIAAEAAIFTIFVVAYLFYAGKSLAGPPQEVLHVPIVFTISLLSSSAASHRNALYLAQGMAKLPGIRVDMESVQTNTVVFRVLDTRFTCGSFIRAAWRYGLRFSEFKDNRLRAVTHLGIVTEDIDSALSTVDASLPKERHR